MAGFDAEEVAGVGGKILGRDGIRFQFQHPIGDRSATVDFSESPPSDLFNMPFGDRYPSLQGSNSMFRKSAVMEVGGFDEEYEYHLEETDLCARLIDAGYVIRHIPDALVHHETAPIPHYRNPKGGYFNRYPFIKNHIYFALKFREYGTRISVQRILEGGLDYLEVLRQQAQRDGTAGIISSADLVRFEEDANRALADGISRGLSGVRKYLNPESPARNQCAFKPFQTLLGPTERLCLCFITRFYDSNPVTSALTLERDFAKEFAGRGHHVHVVTIGEQGTSVDFEDGVWVHRVYDTEKVPTSDRPSIPRPLWDHACRMFQEIERIGSRQRIDFVQWSLFDLEGIAALKDGRYANVISLPAIGETDSRWPRMRRVISGLRNSSAWKSAERFCLEHAPYVLIKDRAVLDAVADRLGLHVPAEKACFLADAKSSDVTDEAVSSHSVDRVLRFYQSIVNR